MFIQKPFILIIFSAIFLASCAPGSDISRERRRPPIPVVEQSRLL